MCVSVVLVTQHAISMRLLYFHVAISAPQFFPALSDKRHDFLYKKYYWRNDVSFDFIYNFVWNISHPQKNQLGIVMNVHRSSYKVHVILVMFSSKLNYSKHFQTILKYKISWKSVQWKPSCSMRTDRQTDRQTGRQTDWLTDMTKLIVTFRNFASAPEKDTRSISDILHACCLERCTISGMVRNKHISTTRINTLGL